MNFVTGNIRVFCRCRPLSKDEASSGFATVVDFDAAKDGDLGIQTGNTKKTFKFDRVFTPKDDQGHSTKKFIENFVSGNIWMCLLSWLVHNHIF